LRRCVALREIKQQEKWLKNPAKKTAAALFGWLRSGLFR